MRIVVSIKYFFAVIFYVLILFSASFAADMERTELLPKAHKDKIVWLADFIALELVSRNIKTVMIEDFTDVYGGHSSEGEKLSGELSVELKLISAGNFNVVSKGADAVVVGVFLPFRDGSKFRLDVNVVTPDKTKIITSYSGVFKKPR